MGFVQGEGRTQGTLFPVTLEELIPDDHVCRVIDAFVGRLDMTALGFERAEAAETEVRGACPLKPRCTVSSRRMIARHLDEEALQRMQQRATPDAMRLRRSTVEHPFANLKYRIFGHPRFLLRGLRGAQTEISLGVAAYNLKRMLNILGVVPLSAAPTSALRPFPKPHLTVFDPSCLLL